MDDINAISIRRQILDWRDKWLSEIPHRLERELVVLFDQINRRIDSMRLKDSFSSKKFIEKEIKPLLEIWVGNETRGIIRGANKELQQIHEAVIDASQSNIDFSTTDDDWSSYLDVVSGVMTAGGALAAIPTVITLSTSATGGVLAALGFSTALVVNWPVALAGVGIVGGLLAFGGSRTLGVVDKKKASLKKSMREMSETIVLYGSDNKTPVSKSLQEAIKETADKLLRAMPHANSV
jgi:hypothetical protein